MSLHICAARVPESQAAEPHSSSVLIGAEDSLQPCSPWPAKLLCQGGSPGKNTGMYWPILVAMPF